MTAGPTAGASGSRQLWFRRLWLSYWVILFAATHAPQPGWPGWAPEPTDKTLHLVAYFLLGWAGWLALTSPSIRQPWRAVEWLGLVAVYAGCDEVLQAVCNRFCSVLDWLADGVGALAAIVVIELYREARRWRRRC